MQNKDYLLPGVAAILVAVAHPIYWLGMSPSVGDYDILWQDMMSLGFSDILFASILLLTIYIYLNLKNILNEQLNFNHIDLLVLIMVAINTLWLGTLFLDIASAVLPENIVTQNKDAFLKINLSVGIGAIVILGIIDLLIGILLLAKSTELPTLLKIFAIMSVIQGVIGMTVVFSSNVNLYLPDNYDYFGYVFST